jgi:hypothetical protein
MATGGGLEIHMEIAHKPAARPGPEPALASAIAAPPARVDVVPMERPRNASRLTAVPFIAVAIVALLVAGIATAFTRHDQTPSTPLAMVQASANATKDAGTAKVSVTAKSTSGPLASGITVDGGFDFDSRRASMQVDTSKFGLPGGKIEAIADYSSGLVMYMKFPTEVATELGNKPWVKMDVGALLKQAGLNVDLGALTQGQSADPTSGLGLLRGADNVVVVGTEVVRGTETTHYRLDVNLDKAVAEAPSDVRDALAKFVNIYTVHTLPVEAWLDAEGRVRRYQQTIDPATIRLPAGVSSRDNPFTGPITTTYEMYDFGSDVNVKIPPPDQVTDLSDLIKQGR